jgi:hypothetical protein
MKNAKNVFVLSVLSASLLAGCGGGSSTTSSTQVVTTGTNTCTSTATGTAVANYVADTVSCGLGYGMATDSATLAAMPTLPSAVAFLIKGTAAGTGFTRTLADIGLYKLTGTTWSALTIPATGVSVDLTATGWVAPTSETTTVTATGLTATPATGAASRTDTNVTYFDLAGKPISCETPVCAKPGNYPAGSAGYYTVQTPVSDDYSLDLVDAFSNFASLTVTDANGAALTTLPTLTTAFCNPMPSALASTVYKPIVGAGAGAANYTSIDSAGTCTAANITTALAGTGMDQTLSLKATGIAGVSVIVSNVNQSQIFGVYQGKVYGGNFEPAGGWPAVGGAPAPTPVPVLKNKTAVNAELVAAGKAALP